MRHLLAALLALVVGVSAQAADAVRLIVPFSAGSSIDVLGRLLAEGMATELGRPVIVENVPGASGQLGVDRVVKATPDGNSIVLAGDAALVVNVGAPERGNFDPLRDLAPITQVAVTPNVLLVAPDSPARNVAELVALAKSKPGQLSYASAGIGTSQHRAGELLGQIGGAELIHVPYSNLAAMTPDVIGGRVTMMFGNVVNALAMAREGRMRALAITSARRSPVAPDLPTMAEAGLPGFEAVAWFGLLAPAGTPAPVVERLHAAATRALQQGALKERLAGMGAEVIGSTPAQFGALIRTETPKWATLRKDNVVKAPGS